MEDRDKLKIVPFKKYEVQGAYHWKECDRSSRDYNPPLEARYRILVNMVKRLKKREWLLDIGCGDGYLMAQLSHVAQKVIGIDSDETAIRLAYEKLCPFLNCKPFYASCYELPFSSNHFDVVLLSDVIEHLPSPETCLKEINRVMKSDGTLLISTPKWRPDRMWDPLHEREYRPRELKNLLKRYFRRVTIFYFWPLIWSNFYSTKIGWRLLKIFARHVYNPFMKESKSNPDKYGQILAVCQHPAPCKNH